MAERITLESLLYDNTPSELDQVLTLESVHQELIALEAYAENNDIAAEFSLDCESGELQFEGYNKYFKPVKFNAQQEMKSTDIVKRFSDAGGEKVIKGMIPIMGKDGYEPIKNEAMLKEKMKIYNGAHPIANLFTGHGNQSREKAVSGTVAVLLNIASFFGFGAGDVSRNVDLLPVGGVLCHVVAWPTIAGREELNKNYGGKPGAIHAVFWNEEKKKFKFLVVGRAKFFGIGNDKEGRMK